MAGRLAGLNVVSDRFRSVQGAHVGRSPGVMQTLVQSGPRWAGVDTARRAPDLPRVIVARTVRSEAGAGLRAG